MRAGARIRRLSVVAVSCALTACAAASGAGKPRDLTPAERESLSQVLEPLLTAAGLWRGPGDGCAAAFVVVAEKPIGAEVVPHAPCRVKLVVTDGALTQLDRETLRVVLAHELGHLQLGHEDARQQRAEERKKTEKGIKSASGAASKAVGLIPGVGGWVSKGISTTRKAATAVMEAQGNAYLGEEERAADVRAVTYLNEGRRPAAVLSPGFSRRGSGTRPRMRGPSGSTSIRSRRSASRHSPGRVPSRRRPRTATRSVTAPRITYRIAWNAQGNAREIARRRGTCAMVAGSSAASGAVWSAVTGAWWDHAPHAEGSWPVSRLPSMAPTACLACPDADPLDRGPRRSDGSGRSSRMT